MQQNAEIPLLKALDSQEACTLRRQLRPATKQFLDINVLALGKIATLLAVSGTSLQLIANQLGHSGTRMAEKHYAHFSPSYVATTIRANKPSYNTTVRP